MNRDGRLGERLLERGSARFTVAPRANRRPFIVRAGDTVVRVVGTRFRVAPATSASWSTSSTASSTCSSAAPAHGARRAGRPGAPDAPNVTTAAAPDHGSGRHRGRPASPAAPASSTAAGEAPGASHGRRRLAPPVDRRAAAYERLDRARGARPLRGARRLPRAVAWHAEWSAVALYAAGRLAADRRDARARTLLAIYLRRYPGGANADDARDAARTPQGRLSMKNRLASRCSSRIALPSPVATARESGTDGGGSGDGGGGRRRLARRRRAPMPRRSARCTLPDKPQCSNCIDDDGDGTIDGYDIECTGAARRRRGLASRPASPATTSTRSSRTASSTATAAPATTAATSTSAASSARRRGDVPDRREPVQPRRVPAADRPGDRCRRSASRPAAR